MTHTFKVFVHRHSKQFGLNFYLYYSNMAHLAALKFEEFLMRKHLFKVCLKLIILDNPKLLKGVEGRMRRKPKHSTLVKCSLFVHFMNL